MRVVTNTSPLHYLILIDEVDVLAALYAQVIIPQGVEEELRHPSTPLTVRTWMASLPGWCEVQQPRQAVPPFLMRLGVGEREAIHLALALPADLLLLDDGQGRRVARQHAIRLTGTLGILGAAAERGLLDFPTAITNLRGTSFHMPSPAVMDTLLARYRKQ